MLPEELKQLKQFMVSRIIERNGRITKEPLNPRTLHLASVTDPNNYESYEFCKKVLVENPDTLAGIAFVFTKQDPYFLIDIDSCIVEGKLKKYAQDITDRFLQTSYIEISQSGKGLHVIGKSGVEINRKVDHPFTVEVYTHSRFVLLTEDKLSSPATLALAPIVFQIFCGEYIPKPKHINSDGSAVWTQTHAQGFSPIESDQKLIEVAGRSHTEGGKSAPFGYLYNYREELDSELAKYHPSTTDSVDRSAMDFSLALKLIFWTAGNCERTLKLMLESGLVRDKWDARLDDYVKRTVQQAFNLQGSYFGVIKEKNAPVIIPVDGKHPFSHCVYINRVQRIFTARRFFMKEVGFKAAYSPAAVGSPYPLHTKADGETKFTNNAWDAFMTSSIAHGAFVDEYCFRSELQPLEVITDGAMRIVNTFFPLKLELDAGDSMPFEKHLKLLLPTDDDCLQVTSWLAAQLQFAGTKFTWSPVLVGCQGNGKTLIGDIMRKIIGSEYTHALRADTVSNHFNAWLDRKIFITVDEIYINEQQKLMDVLKPLISDSAGQLEPKGVDQFTGDNRTNFWMTSNFPEAIKKTDTERRFAIYITPQLTREDLIRDGILTPNGASSKYFFNLRHWLNKENGYAKVANYLLHFEIPDKYNPATECDRAPETSSTRQVIKQTRGIIAHEILEAIESEESGFCGGWIVATRLTELLERKKLARRLPLRKYSDILLTLGYIKHPALPGGRLSKVMIEYGNKRPIIYVKKDSKQSKITEYTEIEAALKKAQRGEY